MSRRRAEGSSGTAADRARLALVGAETPEGARIRQALADRGIPGERVNLFGRTAGEAVLSEYAGEARLIQEPETSEVMGHEVIFLLDVPDGAKNAVLVRLSQVSPPVMRSGRTTPGDRRRARAGRDDAALHRSLQGGGLPAAHLLSRLRPVRGHVQGGGGRYSVTLAGMAAGLPSQGTTMVVAGAREQSGRERHTNRFDFVCDCSTYSEKRGQRLGGLG